MALTITVRWWRPVYEAASGDPEQPEWPPEVVRPFCGMLAAAEDPAEVDALRWLERQGSPDVYCPEATAPDTTRRAYVPTNGVDTKDRHQQYVGRVAAGTPRTWARSFPQLPVAHFVWPSADELDREVLRCLEALAGRVPYVGRATSPAVVSVRPDMPTDAELESLSRFRPEDSGTRLLRVPYPGYVDGLVDAYETSQPSWDVARRVAYDHHVERADEGSVAGPFHDDLIVFELEKGRQIDGAHAVRLASAFRAAVMSRAAEPVAALHGHHDGDEQQIAFLPLPFVGHHRADGHLMGVAVALPVSLRKADRAVVLRALLGDGVDDKGLQEISFARRRIVVRRRPAVFGRREGVITLRSDRWTEASKTWVTALPMVLDRFPKERTGGIEAEVRRSLRYAGFDDAEIEEVEVSRRPLLSGGVRLHPRQAVRHRGESYVPPVRHVRLRFRQRVRGPVVLGHLRFYGLGLCRPLPEGRVS